jgi:RHS repeat-associated protein
MSPSAKNSIPFWFTTNSNFEEKSFYPFGSYPKQQISDLVVLAVPFSIRDILSSVSKGEYGKYRYSFNGMEKDNELKGEVNSLDFGARIYDSRLGRWLSVDPLAHKYVQFSSYNFCFNNPNYFIDLDGQEVFASNTFQNSVYYSTVQNIINQNDQIDFTKKYLKKYLGTELDLKLHYYNTVVDNAGYSNAYVPQDDKGNPINCIIFNSSQVFMHTELEQGGVFSSFVLTEIGRANVFLHELFHLDGKDHETISSSSYRREIEEGLRQYANLNQLSIPSQDFTFIAWIGLEETKAFKEEFGEVNNRSSVQQTNYDKYKLAINRSYLVKENEIYPEKINKELSITPESQTSFSEVIKE